MDILRAVEARRSRYLNGEIQRSGREVGGRWFFVQQADQVFHRSEGQLAGQVVPDQSEIRLAVRRLVELIGKLITMRPADAFAEVFGKQPRKVAGVGALAGAAVESRVAGSVAVIGLGAKGGA